MVSINLLAQKERFSLFHKKKQPDSNIKIRLFGVNLKNNTRNYFPIAGTCILLGGFIQIATNFIDAPIAPPLSITTSTNSAQNTNSYNNYLKASNKYLDEYKRWSDIQKTLHITSAALYTLGGLFIIVASKKIIDTKTASLKLNASPTSIGLCLNFK